jgi:hypothetical protein
MGILKEGRIKTIKGLKADLISLNVVGDLDLAM